MWEWFKKTWNKVKAAAHGVNSWMNEFAENWDVDKANKEFKKTFQDKNTEYEAGRLFEKAGSAVAQGFNQVKELAQSFTDGRAEKKDQSHTAPTPPKSPRPESPQTTEMRHKYHIQTKQSTQPKTLWTKLFGPKDPNAAQKPTGPGRSK